MSTEAAPATSSPVRLVAVAAVSPPKTMTQDEAARAIEERYAAEVRPRTLAAMRKVFSHPSVRARRFAFDDVAEVFDETPDERIGRFARWSVRLAGFPSRERPSATAETSLPRPSGSSSSAS